MLWFLLMLVKVPGGMGGSLYVLDADWLVYIPTSGHMIWIGGHVT